MCDLALNGGLRVSEIVSLRYEDVDLMRCRLFVRRAAWNKPGTKGRRNKKGESRARRFVHVPCQLIRRLRSRSTGWVFPSPKATGRHVTTRWAEKALARATDGAIRFHDLRHAYASKLWEWSQQLPLVQLNLGHRKLSTTMVYVAVPTEFYDGSYTGIDP
jgi:integrase